MTESTARGLSPFTRVLTIAVLVVTLVGLSIFTVVFSVYTTESVLELVLAVVAAFVLTGLAGYIVMQVRALSDDIETRDVVGGVEPIPEGAEAEEETTLSAEEFELLYSSESGDTVTLTAGDYTGEYTVAEVTPAGGGRILRVGDDGRPITIVLDERMESAHLIVGVGDAGEKHIVTAASSP